MSVVRAIASKLGPPDPSRGPEFVFECIKCGKRKLGVNIKKMLMHCFRCGFSGTVADLARLLGLTLDDFSGPMAKAKPAAGIPTSIPGFVPITAMDKSVIAQQIREHAFERGGLNGNDLHERWWGYSIDSRLAGRLIIPLTEEHRTVSWIARSVFSFITPKEISAPTAEGWWPKGRVGYGVDRIGEEVDVVLVEGIWDREAVVRSGWHGAVALLGSQLTDELAGRILAKRPRTITLCLDGDEAGKQATTEIKRKLRHRFQAGKIRTVELPDGKDPDELLADGELNGYLSNTGTAVGRLYS